MSDEKEIEAERFVSVSHTSLSKGALKGVIESFVLQEGTDYGSQEFSLEQKVSQVLAQLERGDAEIVYDSVEESCSITRRKHR